jgi:hypothetical protein
MENQKQYTGHENVPMTALCAFVQEAKESNACSWLCENTCIPGIVETSFLKHLQNSLDRRTWAVPHTCRMWECGKILVQIVIDGDEVEFHIHFGRNKLSMDCACAFMPWYGCCHKREMRACKQAVIETVDTFERGLAKPDSTDAQILRDAAGQ